MVSPHGTQSNALQRNATYLISVAHTAAWVCSGFGMQRPEAWGSA